MLGKREQKRADLKAKLLAATILRIENDGIASLRARDLAKDAGCALGAIYNIYEDLDELIFHAKVEIFRRMEERLADTMSNTHDLSPLDQMRKLTSSYFQFAQDNTKLWTALFTGDLTDQRDVPKWYQDALMRLMGHIHGPLKQIAPDTSDKELSLQTRTLFSAIHGVILLSIQDRPSGVTHQEVEKATDWLLESISKHMK